MVDPSLTVAAYAARWLGIVGQTVKPRTLKSYRDTLWLHILPAVGAVQVRRLPKGQVKSLLAAKLQSGLARNSVRIILATLRAMLNAAVDDGVILTNPADRLGRTLKLTQRAHGRREEIKAFTREQLAIFLATAGELEPRHFPLFFAMARTGLRLGEALALQWEDVDLDAGTLSVRVALQRVGGKLQLVEPKTARSRRTIAFPRAAVTALHAHRARQLREQMAARARWQDTGLVFTTTLWTPLDARIVTRHFKRALKEARLPLLRFHDLRHTCASLLLAQGVHPRVVMEALGHSQISLTMNTYSHVVEELQREAAAKMDAALAASGTH